MIFGDYAPPASPTPEQQRDALRKGLGRALQWALGRKLGDEPLLAACLRDQRFDTQCESERGDWLWRLVQAVGATDRFRVPILHALHDLSDDRSVNQLCELARRYAATGDEPFRTRLYEIVEQKPVADRPWLGDAEVIELDGEQGFLFAARVRGRLLAGRDWEWDDRSLVGLAVERFGEEQVHRLLATSTDAAVRRFRERWLHDEQTTAKPVQPGHDRERMAATPVQEVIRAAEGEGKDFWLRGWGRYAKDADLRVVLQRLGSEPEPRVVANLLRVFSARPLPEFDPRLIELCRHDDDAVRRRALAALRKNAHPLVREFALSELQGGVRDGAVVALFINNYQPGDEHRILEAMELPEDGCELHWLLMDVIKVLEENPAAEAARLGLISYGLTPCENCRFDAARLLLKQHAAPDWLADECRYDSCEDCRALPGALRNE